MIATLPGTCAPVVLGVGRAATPNEAADVLAVLYPALLRFAENELRHRHLDHQLAEDLVQEAAASWFRSGAQLYTSAEMSGHLRLTITNRAKNLAKRRNDALDQNPLSLDASAEDEED